MSKNIIHVYLWQVQINRKLTKTVYFSLNKSCTLRTVQFASYALNITQPGLWQVYTQISQTRIYNSREIQMKCLQTTVWLIQAIWFLKCSFVSVTSTSEASTHVGKLQPCMSADRTHMFLSHGLWWNEEGCCQGSAGVPSVTVKALTLSRREWNVLRMIKNTEAQMC